MITENCEEQDVSLVSSIYQEIKSGSKMSFPILAPTSAVIHSCKSYCIVCQNPEKTLVLKSFLKFQLCYLQINKYFKIASNLPKHYFHYAHDKKTYISQFFQNLPNCLNLFIIISDMYLTC